MLDSILAMTVTSKTSGKTGRSAVVSSSYNEVCWFLVITMKLAAENLQNVVEATSRHLCRGFILNLNKTL